MLEQLLEPFATWDAWTITKWYFGCIGVTGVLLLLHKKAGLISSENPIEKVPVGLALLSIGFAVPILEEIIFRGIPTFIGGFNLIIAGTIIWTLLHGKRALIIAPFGVLFLKLWMGGFGIEATVIHILHNSFLVAIYLATNDIADVSEYMDQEKTNVDTTIRIHVSD